MMKSKLSSVILACLLLSLAACDLPIYPVAPAATLASMPTVPTVDPAIATAVAGTQIAEAINATIEAMSTPLPPDAPASDTPQATATATPTFTPTITVIPSPTSTSTLSPTATLPLPPSPTFTGTVPLLSVSIATNCRSGPGQAYNILGGIQPGQFAEIVAQSATPNYWVVRLPSNPTVICWAWGQYATISGNLTGLPVFTPPPTPTPAPGFSVSYLGLTSCAPQYAFQFMVENTGTLTWESIRIVVTDNTTATTFTHILDAFRTYASCVLGDLNQDLMPGESGGVANVNPGQLNYNPTGHSITATITVCSENGLGGTCRSQTLNFTP